MIKQYVGCFGRILMRETGVAIYMIFSARFVREWMMRWRFRLLIGDTDIE